MNRIILSLTLFFFWIQVFGQTPPARTWYYNDYGVKTEVKERWDEDADGFKHGKYISYSSYFGGTTFYVEEVGNFNHGKMEGIWKNFYPNGSIYSIGSYKNNGKVGYWKEVFDSEEKVFQEGTYVNGKRNGIWINTDDKETKKGYKATYKNGEVISVIDDKGVNLLEAQKQKEAKEEFNKNLESNFYKCSTVEGFENFRKIYPNSRFDNDAIAQINRFNAQEQEKIFLVPLIKKWNNMSDEEKNSTFFNEYFQKFPNGDRVNEVNNLITKYEKRNQEIQSLTEQLNNCNSAFCMYLFTNTLIANKANEKLLGIDKKIKFNKDGSSYSGEIPFSYDLAMEIKEKFGINIFRYLNYEGGYEKSYLLLEGYPKMLGNTSKEDLIKTENGFLKRTFIYKTKNHKLQEVKIKIDKESSYHVFKFNKEGWLQYFERKHINIQKDSRESPSYVNHEYELDINGKYKNSNLIDSDTNGMF
jgi:hypothetical protein